MPREENPIRTPRRPLPRGWILLIILVVVAAASVLAIYLFKYHRRNDFGAFNRTPAARGASHSPLVAQNPVIPVRPFEIDSLPPLPPKPQDATAPRRAARLAKFFNRSHGYSFDYDSSAFRFDFGPDQGDSPIYEQQRMTGMGVMILEGRLADYKTDPDPIRACAVREAARHCDADGPDGSSRCEPATDVGMYKSSGGLRVLVFHQTHVSTYLDSTYRTVFGPYYAVDLSYDGIRRAVFLYSDSEPSPRTEFLMRELANSITRIEP